MASSQVKKTQSTFVYFIRQREVGFSLHKHRVHLKIGHSKNPKRRCYSFQDYEYASDLLHTIEVSSKQLACELERGFIRCLKDRGFKPYFETREWFPFEEGVEELLASWGITNV